MEVTDAEVGALHESFRQIYRHVNDVKKNIRSRIAAQNIMVLTLASYWAATTLSEQITDYWTGTGTEEKANEIRQSIEKIFAGLDALEKYGYFLTRKEECRRQLLNVVNPTLSIP